MHADASPHLQRSTTERTFLAGMIQVLIKDICLQHVEAIVNAANSTLLAGGDVDGAIHEVGGPQILAECEALRRMRYPQGLPTGEAVITYGGMLPTRYVIHTLGPIKDGHGERAAMVASEAITRFLKRDLFLTDIRPYVLGRPHGN